MLVSAYSVYVSVRLLHGGEGWCVVSKYLCTLAPTEKANRSVIRQAVTLIS